MVTKVDELMALCDRLEASLTDADDTRHRLLDAIPMWTFWVGIIKAPVFAFLIAMVGCYEGFQVEGSAESVGKLTTQSVVEAIFLVIIFDAAFSILFSYLGV